MTKTLNYSAWWKYCLLFIIILAGFIYAAPNIYPEYPAVQIKTLDETHLPDGLRNNILLALTAAKITPQSIESSQNSLLLLFSSTDIQLKAKEILQATLGNQYLIALNLAPTTPDWLKAIGAVPMKLGLDLRGGVHFLLQVDVDSVVQQRTEGDIRGMMQMLREQRIRYAGIARKPNKEVWIQLRTEEAQHQAYRALSRRFNEFIWKEEEHNHAFILRGTLSPTALFHAKEEILEQAMNTLRNRVNELGVSEAIVQQQGDTRVAVDLPGIQDTAQAKNILGKTATLEFHMVDTEHNAAAIAKEGIPPMDARLYYHEQQPILLKNQIVLRGSSIVSAMSGFGEDGRPNVNIRLGGAGESLFTKVTSENIGKPMAVVYVEVKSVAQPAAKGNEPHITYLTERKIINVAIIQSALGNNFQISGISSQQEARVLALLLRAGALPAPVTIIEERQVGPSLGQQNIHMGILSVEVGMGLVIAFMILYYGLMGLIADIALVMNLILMVAILSLLGATLTLPGIAGIVLTVGMAVDANVLIFERIREELRRGSGVQTSIHAGYERAFVTILDANLTTLIVMLILFSLGSGTVKGLAITVTVGLITSMFTAITGTRTIVNFLYGRRAIKRISIGI